MEIFLKAAAGVLITVILCLALEKQSKELSVLLVMTVCCMIIGAAINYLKPVFTLFEKLQSIGKLNEEMMRVLLKAVGIGLVAEITAMICSDSGNNALGKAIKLIAAGVILCISIPLFESLLELIEEILVML